MPLLGGRLTLALPADARQVWPRGLTPLPPGAFEAETGWRMGRGTVLTVRAIETLALAGDEFEARVRAKDATTGANGVISAFSLRGLPALLSSPPRALSREVLVERVWLQMPEGTVSLVEFIIARAPSSPPLEPDVCRPTIRELAAGLELGSAKLSLAGGAMAVGPLVELTVPAGFAVEHQATNEVPTLVVRRPVPLGERGARLTISITQHPPNIAMPVDRSGPYLGKTVAWRNGYTEGKETRTAILRVPGHGEYAFSLIEALDTAAVDELIGIASTLRLRP